MFADIYSKLALVIGRVQPHGVDMLGTGFLVSKDGKVATTHHVVGNDATNLVVLLPGLAKAGDFQDLADTACQTTPATPIEIDPLKDIAILQTSLVYSAQTPELTNFDGVQLGDRVHIYGYPHCVQGRRAFTAMTAEVGSKVLMTTNGIVSKHAVINTQTRPGQSGSPVVNAGTGEVFGMLVGAWVAGAGISLGGINPHELHQTTHCISAAHIKEML